MKIQRKKQAPAFLPGIEPVHEYQGVAGRAHKFWTHVGLEWQKLVTARRRKVPPDENKKKSSDNLIRSSPREVTRLSARVNLTLQARRIGKGQGDLLFNGRRNRQGDTWCLLEREGAQRTRDSSLGVRKVKSGGGKQEPSAYWKTVGVVCRWKNPYGTATWGDSSNGMLEGVSGQ